MKDFLLKLFVDRDLLEVDISQQTLVIRSALVLGLPISLVLIFYELSIGHETVAIFAAAFFLVMVITLIVHLLPIEAMAKYIMIKVMSVFFIILYGAIMVYVVTVEQDFSRIPWAYLLPITSFYLLGTRMSIPLVTLFLVSLIGGMYSLPVQVLASQNINDLLIRVVVTLPLVCAVAYIVIYILKKHQIYLVKNRLSLEESEKRFREANESLLRENAERKRYEKELRNSIHEKEVLLKEIHHRVKNNLQVVSSLLNLEAMKTDDPAVLYFVNNSQRRIQTMQMVHEMLYTGKEVSRIDLSAYIENIVSNIQLMHSNEDRKVSITIDIPAVSIDIETAISCGLLVNEIVTNSMKHAFKGKATGRVVIGLASDATGVRLDIADDGIGFIPDGVTSNGISLGLTLVEGLVRQMGGEMTVATTEGTRFTFTFGVDSRFRLHGVDSDGGDTDGSARVN